MDFWLDKLWRAKAYDISEACGRFHMLRAHISFATPMVGASPDNIGAQRLAEGGVPASGAGSAPQNQALIQDNGPFHTSHKDDT